MNLPELSTISKIIIGLFVIVNGIIVLWAYRNYMEYEKRNKK
jgi:hypothetical protein